MATVPVTFAALPVQEPELPEQFPVTFPVNGPENAVAVNVPVDASQFIDFATVFEPEEMFAFVTEYHKI